MGSDSHLQATVSTRAVLFAGSERFLSVKRAVDDEWELPGGRLEHDEGVRDCLRRELVEETGLAANVGEPVHTRAYRNEDDQGRLVLYYLCTAERRTIHLSNEHVASEWVPLTNDLDILSNHATTAVEKAITRLEASPADSITMSHPELSATSE